jgi:hypothetical protein
VHILFFIFTLITGFLPNSSSTPGAIDPSVRQSNIHSTICVTGYTSTVRPSSSYTTSLKIQQLHSGYAINNDFKTGDYEEDHLISLELGGAPSDPRNLWPEPYTGSNGARVKDKIENKLHQLVCSGTISLAHAQQVIASDWESAYRTYIGPITSSTPNNSNSGQGAHKKTTIDPRFRTCKLANASGYGPYFRSTNPEYFWYRDSNSDGKVC